jgi:fused signal recognition particle receptor
MTEGSIADAIRRLWLQYSPAPIDPSDPIVLTAAAATLALIILAVWLLLRRRPTTPAASQATPWVTGLAKTRGTLAQRLGGVWRAPGAAADILPEIEAVLLSADVGVAATRRLIDELQADLGRSDSAEAIRDALQTRMRAFLADANGDAAATAKPHVVLVVGVNGVGKTTTIGKLAHRYRREGKQVLLVAADTFRAAATEQLTLWAERVGADIVKHQQGADPSAVVFDGMKAGIAREADVIIIDTAGRLHVKENLMQEVQKIGRTIARQLPGAPHEVLLVIDATTGQNALSQARVFHEALQVTGVVLAKLDGTAKGGIALAIRGELGLPIRYVGLGEGVDDLAPFDADAFVAAVFADEVKAA